MERVKAIIVDDEPGCVSNLAFYLNKYCPLIEVVGTETEPENIPNLLRKEFRIAFLDIEIYKDNIFNILSGLDSQNIDFVFVTAYEKYALKSFDVDVLDYILKPLRKNDIINCYNKILKRVTSAVQNTDLNDTESDKLTVKQRDSIYIVQYEDIVFLKARGAYTEVCFYNNNDKIIATISKALNKHFEIEKNKNFIKVHRSYLINMLNVKRVHNKKVIHVEMNTGEFIPIAKRRVNDFLAAIKKL